MSRQAAATPENAPTVQQLLAFYLEAGVDCALAEEPIDRLSDQTRLGKLLLDSSFVSDFSPENNMEMPSRAFRCGQIGFRMTPCPDKPPPRPRTPLPSSSCWRFIWRPASTARWLRSRSTACPIRPG